jgi:hypothetical protein
MRIHAVYACKSENTDRALKESVVETEGRAEGGMTSAKRPDSSRRGVLG